MTDDVIRDLQKSADATKAASCLRFFKTGKGEYGEGDVFIGITVPQVRIVVKKYHDLPLNQVFELLKNPIHECRLCALLILVDQFKRGDEIIRRKIFDLYLKNTRHINNWDLVDCSAHKVVGAMLFEINDTALLDELADSNNLWEQRIAIISTGYFIGNHDFKPTLRIAKKLLSHHHDLIHKAVGWMLREVGKRDQKVLIDFLKKHHNDMPRTALRYAIEKFSKQTRKKYLSGSF